MTQQTEALAPSRTGPPIREDQRLRALHRYQILDTEPEGALDDLARLAAAVCEAPMGLVSFVDRERAWFKARFGSELEEIPRKEGFCGHAVQGTELFEVPDARSDHRFASLPLVRQPGCIRFYAGMPLVTRDGFSLGTLCVLDQHPRQLTPSQGRALEILSRVVMEYLELRLGRITSRCRERCRALMEQVPAVFWTTDRDLNFTSSAGAGHAVLGLRPGEMRGQSLVQYLGNGDPSAAAVSAHRLALRGEVVTFEQRWRGRVYHCHVEPLGDGRHGVTGCAGLALDITERKRAEERLRYRMRMEEVISGVSRRFVHQGSDDPEESLGRALEEIGRFTGARRAFLAQIEAADGGEGAMEITHQWCAGETPPYEGRQLRLALGTSAPWLAKRLRAQEALILEHPEELPPEAVEERDWLRRRGVEAAVLVPLVYRGTPRGLLAVETAGGGHPWPEDAEVLLRVVGEILIGALERARTEKALLHSALHDSLTDLPNRALFLDRLCQAADRTRRRPGEIFAVLFLDLDRFKLVNDSMGHMVGDRLLVEIVHRLARCLRPEDTLARFGGDEFVVLVEDLRRPEDATRVAERMQQALAEPFHLAGQELFISASTGIALSGDPEAAANPEILLRDADTAMYRAKGQGRGRHVIFDPVMHARSVARLRMETDLHLALERGEFELHYQPVFDLIADTVGAGGGLRVAGLEALLRWRHPARGVLRPGDFLAMAEDAGLLHRIGLWVLETACEERERWRREGGETPLPIGVNLAPSQLLRRGFLDDLSAVLERSGADPALLRLEITESAVLEGADAVDQVMGRLRDMDLRLHIDDFGTGHSCLSQLLRFPIEALKVDGSFVARLDGEEPGAGESARIVGAIVTLAHDLGLRVVAEGVETAAQLERLRRLGVDQAQGELLSPPLPARRVAAALFPEPSSAPS